MRHQFTMLRGLSMVVKGAEQQSVGNVAQLDEGFFPSTFGSTSRSESCADCFDFNQGELQWCDQVGFIFAEEGSAGRSYIYLTRLAAFLLILIAIIDKNSPNIWWENLEWNPVSDKARNERLQSPPIIGFDMRKTRPLGVTALSIFFFAATLITIVAATSLLFPDGFLEPIWKLNPRGQAGLYAIGLWAILLFSMVGLACAVAAVGLWQGRWWGYFTAITVLSLNLFGDLFNVISGIEPRAAIGIPIVGLIMVYLFRPKVRLFFSRPLGL